MSKTFKTGVQQYIATSPNSLFRRISFSQKNVFQFSQKCVQKFLLISVQNWRNFSKQIPALKDALNSQCIILRRIFRVILRRFAYFAEIFVSALVKGLRCSWPLLKIFAIFIFFEVCKLFSFYIAILSISCLLSN